MVEPKIDALELLKGPDCKWLAPKGRSLPGPFTIKRN
jgi:hypothetical protein